MRIIQWPATQIIEAIRRVEAGLAVPTCAGSWGICSATFYKWRSKYGDMDVSPIVRTKKL